MKWYQLLVLPAVFVATVGFVGNSVAETTDSGEELTIVEQPGTTASVVAAPSASEAGLRGSLEVRPTLYMGGSLDNTKNLNKNKYGLENTAEIGWRFNKDLSLIAHTEINNNLKDEGRSSTVWMGDTIVRLPFNNIWQSSEAGLAFSWEPRVYLPTSDDRQGTGYVGTVRNYLKLKKTIVSNLFDVTLMEIPVLNYFNNSRNLTPDAFGAIYQNRVYLVADFSLFDNKVSFSMPFLTYQTFNRTSAAKASINNVTHVAYIWPELTYAVTKNFDVGVAYQSGNFIVQDKATGDNSFSASNAFDNGMFQVILRASL